MSIPDLVTKPIASVSAADALLELSFLMTAVDGYLADEENAVFAALLEKVRESSYKAELDALLERFVTASHAVGVDARVRQVAPTIPADLRELAFTVAVGLSFVDGDESEYEGELADVLEATFALGDRKAALVEAARKAARG